MSKALPTSGFQNMNRHKEIGERKVKPSSMESNILPSGERAMQQILLLFSNGRVEEVLLFGPNQQSKNGTIAQGGRSVLDKIEH